MDALTLKVEALAWLRFGKKMFYIATEVGKFNADVLGLCDTYSVEVEVKMSKQDLGREFTGKAAKHAVYARAADTPTLYVPNYLYFYVPEALEAEALRIVGEKAPRAGVAVYEPGKRLDGKNTRTAKRALRLHDRPPSPRLQEVVLRRMGSELCGRHIAWRELSERLNNALAGVDAVVVKTIKQAVATPDFEEGDGLC